MKMMAVTAKQCNPERRIPKDPNHENCNSHLNSKSKCNVRNVSKF